MLTWVLEEELKDVLGGGITKKRTWAWDGFGMNDGKAARHWEVL